MQRTFLILSSALLLLFATNAWAEEVFLECTGGCEGENTCNKVNPEFNVFAPDNKVNITLDTTKRTIEYTHPVKYEGTGTIDVNWKMSNPLTERDTGKYVDRRLILNRVNGFMRFMDTSWNLVNPQGSMNMAWYSCQCKKIEPLF